MGKQLGYSLNYDHYAILKGMAAELGLEGPGPIVRAAIYDWLCFANEHNKIPDNLPELTKQEQALSRFLFERRMKDG